MQSFADAQCLGQGCQTSNRSGATLYPNMGRIIIFFYIIAMRLCPPCTAFLGRSRNRALATDHCKSPVTPGWAERIFLLHSKDPVSTLHTFTVFSSSARSLSQHLRCLLYLSAPSCLVSNHMGPLCSEAADAVGMHEDLSSERDPGSYIRACLLFSSWQDVWNHALDNLVTPSFKCGS